MIETRHPLPEARDEEIKFDFENLKVYQKALNFIDEVFSIIKNLPISGYWHLVSFFSRL